ncbi:Uncharacterized protein OBRU01_13047 [Operophtera brumata]|uniref:Uncharacterized protein n=1 Tax=Operophtera brumata TaxID=104452 RepID=A0A0L7L8Y4_OPEBR|nr:Uncharacterized protein OBRU01_13047 [Operophtera brumata]
MRDTLIFIFNTPLDDRAWCQASLPIRMGGLGVRKITSVSIPAFLSSIFGTQDLIRKILSKSTPHLEIAGFLQAQEAWKAACPDSNLPKEWKFVLFVDNAKAHQVVPSYFSRWQRSLAEAMLENFIDLL